MRLCFRPLQLGATRLNGLSPVDPPPVASLGVGWPLMFQCRIVGFGTTVFEDGLLPCPGIRRQPR